jgi:hypothetical protein
MNMKKMITTCMMFLAALTASAQEQQQDRIEYEF